jgi:hypothetical protein
MACSQPNFNADQADRSGSDGYENPFTGKHGLIRIIRHDPLDPRLKLRQASDSYS